jgi:hypothetical protein
MAVRGQLPDSLLQPPCCADSRRSGARERLSISFTDCKALWIRYHFSGRRPLRFKAGVDVGRIVSACRPFISVVRTLYIHEVMISIFSSTSSVSGLIVSGIISTASLRKTTVSTCMTLFAMA